MKIRVEDGFGRPVGMLEIPESFTAQVSVRIEWHTKIKHGLNEHGYVHSIVLPLGEVIPYGWHIRTGWKERERLKRAGLLLPYEEIIRYRLNEEKTKWVKI